MHDLVKEQQDRKPLSEIMLMREDAMAVDRSVELIKAKYTQFFGV